MPLPIRDWRDYPDTSTPLNAAALEDLETRLSQYSEAVAQSINVRSTTTATTLTSTDQVLLADATGLPAPLGLAGTPQAGGTFPAGTYAWTVTAINGSGVESVAPVAIGKDLTLNQGVELTWTAVPGATGYRIYRSPFAWSNAGTLSWARVTQVGNVTSYTDTGTATTAATPPTTNGAAFAVTLPTAVDYTGRYTIRATGRTTNLVTLTPQAGQTIDGDTTFPIGVAVPGGYHAVTLASDGANWRVIDGVHNITRTDQAENVYAVSCNSVDVGQALVVVPCPPLIPLVSRMTFNVSFSVTAGAGTSKLLASINKCNSDGSYPAGNVSNIAFWEFKDFAIAELKVFSAHWSYDPRAGDTDLGNGTGNYLGLHLASYDGISNAFNGAIQVTSGTLPSKYWPNP